MRSPAAAERAEEATVEGGSLAGPAAASLFFSLMKEHAAAVKCALGWGIGWAVCRVPRSGTRQRTRAAGLPSARSGHSANVFSFFLKSKP